MADLKQYNEVFERKASLLSMEKFSQKLDNPPAPPPEDKYYFIMTFFVILGFAIMIPFTFLLTATDNRSQITFTWCHDSNEYVFHIFHDIGESKYGFLKIFHACVHFPSERNIRPAGRNLCSSNYDA
nr:uncharacterized protein LOC111507337 isoform X4 [Leptinotarsa decemlineata]